VRDYVGRCFTASPSLALSPTFLASIQAPTSDTAPCNTAVGMPPSWSAVERADPPPRKKSCAGCIKAKRRCSQDVPSCQRCRQRRLECKYASGRTPKPPLNHESSPELATPTPSTAHTVHVVDAGSDSGQITPTHRPRVFVTPHEFAYTDLWTPSISSTEGVTVPSGSLSTPSPRFVELPPGAPPTSTSTSEVLDVLAATRPFSEISDAVAYAMKIRLQYALDRTSFAVNQMVFECSTPWSHPHLYQRETPRAMQGTVPCFLFPFLIIPARFHSIFKDLNIALLVMDVQLTLTVPRCPGILRPLHQ
jgi:hypothetical protein